MFNRRNSENYLNIALTARLAIDTLVGFFDGEEIHHAADKGIQVIKEVRAILQRLNELEHTTTFFEFNRSLKHPFDSYESINFLKEIVDNMKWDSWESDLEQRGANKEKVMDYFVNVEGTALSRYQEDQYGGF